jgi:hypothetical protein
MRRLSDHLRGATIIEPLENRQLLSANLVPAFAGHLPSAIAPSGVTHVNVRVVDSGTAPAAETMTVRLYASADASLDGSDVLLGTAQRNINLKPHRGTQITLNVPTPTNLPDGQYELIAQVDGASPIAVSKKLVVFQNPFSDLAVQFGRLPSQPIEIDGPSAGHRSVGAKITNTGNITARGKVSVSFYLSTDTVLDSTDPLLTTVVNQSVALRPHASKAISFRVAIPPGTAVGAYFLFAVLSPASGVTDSNPANNTAISPQRVPVVTQLPHPTRVDNHYYYYNDNGFFWDYGFFPDSTVTVDSSSDNPSYDSGYSSADNSSPDSTQPTTAPSDNGSSDSSSNSDNSSASDDSSSDD